MPANLAAYNDALKEVWTQDHLESQIYEKDPFLDKIEKTAKYHIGSRASVPLLLSRNGGFSMAPSSGSSALNAAGNVGIDRADYQYAWAYQQVKIEHAAIESTSDKSTSVANVIDTEMQGATSALRKQLTRQAFGNGDALIAQCAVTTTSNTIVLNAAANDAIVRRWLYPGLTVDIGTTGSEGAIASDVVITAVAKSTTAPTITVSGSTVSTTASHYVSIANARAGTTSYETNGLRNIVSLTAILGTLDPASVPEWAAAGVDTTTTTLTLDAMYDQQENVQQATGEDFDLVLTSLKQRKNFYKLLQMQTRFDGDRSLGAGGVETTSFAGMNIQAHVDCPGTQMWFLNTSDFLGLKTPRGSHWQSDYTGGKPLDWIQGTTAFGGVLMNPFQIGVKRRNSHAGLTALA